MATGVSSSACETRINGFSILFPEGKKPFAPQLAVISKVLKALNNKENALLESPTGTGKTLAFLTSTLSWQKSVIDNNPGGVVASTSSSGASGNSNNSGDGNGIKNEYNSDPEDDSDPNTDNSNGGAPKNSKPVKIKPVKAPKVFFCTRTHSQLKQIVNELHNCHVTYTASIKMCVLGSRKQSCINHKLREKVENKETTKSLEESCREIRLLSCPFGSHKKLKPLVYAMNQLTVWDIEDAIMLGNQMKGCPYYASRVIFEEKANYVLAPYNYIIESSIRKSLKIDLKDSVVIFDEAHNIEDVCRDAGSAELSKTNLESCHGQLKRLAKTGSVPHKALLGLMSNLLDWIEDMTKEDNNTTTPGKMTSSAVDGNGWTPNQNNKTGGKFGAGGAGQALLDAADIWEGPELLDIFEDKLGLTPDTHKMYQAHFEAIAAQEEDMEGIIDALNLDGDNGESASSDTEDGDEKNTNREGKKRVDDLAYEKENNNNNKDKDRDSGNDSEDDVIDSAKKSTPGKSPDKKKLSGNSFAVLSGLLNALDYMMRNNRIHASDYRVVLNKVSVQDFSRGRGTYGRISMKLETMLNFWCMSAAVVFKEINDNCHSVLLTSGTLSPLDSFASELGSAFPVRVEASHVINIATQLFVGVVHTCNDALLKGDYANQNSTYYQDAIGASLMAITRVTPGGVLMFLPSYGMLNKLQERWTSTGLLQHIEDTTGAKTFFEPRDSKQMVDMLVGYYGLLDEPRGKAILVAVCRGKVSEGINFSDHYARAVLIVGIPFPNTQDLKVQLKKKYQNLKSMNDILYSSGDEWYKQQAFRAVNQAIGRCIRHKHDYGAIFLLDPRFQGETVMNNMSRWMRTSAVTYSRLEDAILPVKSFFNKLLPGDSEHLLTYADFKLRAAAIAVEKEYQRIKEENCLDEDEIVTSTTVSKGKTSLNTATADGKPLKRQRKNSSKETAPSTSSAAVVIDLEDLSTVNSSNKNNGMHSSNITNAFRRMTENVANKTDLRHSKFLAASEILLQEENTETAAEDGAAGDSYINPLLISYDKTCCHSPMICGGGQGGGNAVRMVSTEESSRQTASVFQSLLTVRQFASLTALVNSWDWSGGCELSPLPPSLTTLQTAFLNSSAQIENAAKQQQYLAPFTVPPSPSSSRSTAPLSHSVTLPNTEMIGPFSPVRSGSALRRSISAVLVGQPKNIIFPQVATSSVAVDALSLSTPPTAPTVTHTADGLFSMTEKWCHEDGVVYQLLFINISSTISVLIAVKVIAANTIQSHLVGSCYVLQEMVALCVDGSNNNSNKNDNSVKMVPTASTSLSKPPPSTESIHIKQEHTNTTDKSSSSSSSNDISNSSNISSMSMKEFIHQAYASAHSDAQCHSVTVKLQQIVQRVSANGGGGLSCHRWDLEPSVLCDNGNCSSTNCVSRIHTHAAATGKKLVRKYAVSGAKTKSTSINITGNIPPSLTSSTSTSKIKRPRVKKEPNSTVSNGETADGQNGVVKKVRRSSKSSNSVNTTTAAATAAGPVLGPFSTTAQISSEGAAVRIKQEKDNNVEHTKQQSSHNITSTNSNTSVAYPVYSSPSPMNCSIDSTDVGTYHSDNEHENAGMGPRDREMSGPSNEIMYGCSEDEDGVVIDEYYSE